MPTGKPIERRAYEGGWTAKDSLPLLQILLTGKEAVLVPIEIGEALFGFVAVGLLGDELGMSSSTQVLVEKRKHLRAEIDALFDELEGVGSFGDDDEFTCQSGGFAFGGQGFALA